MEVSGCGALKIDEEAKTLITPDGTVYKEGDYMSIDGSTGNVYGTQVKTVEPDISGDFGLFMSWADEVRRLKIRTNADTQEMLNKQENLALKVLVFVEQNICSLIQIESLISEK